MIRDKIFGVLHQIPTSDLSLECLTALIAIMLAQAQESFCLKAIQGTDMGFLKINGKYRYVLITLSSHLLSPKLLISF